MKTQTGSQRAEQQALLEGLEEAPPSSHHYLRPEPSLHPSPLPCLWWQGGVAPVHSAPVPSVGRNFLLFVKYWLRLERALLRLCTSTEEAEDEGDADRQWHQGNAESCREQTWRARMWSCTRAQLSLHLHMNKLVFTWCTVRKDGRSRASKLKLRKQSALLKQMTKLPGNTKNWMHAT